LAPAPAGNFDGPRGRAGGDFIEQISENFCDLIVAQFDYVKLIQ